METPNERLQIIIAEAGKEASEHILSNQAELYQFLMDNLVVLETLTNIITINWKRPEKIGWLIKQQLKQDTLEICTNDERARLS